jgi:hypothetical protein
MEININKSLKYLKGTFSPYSILKLVSVAEVEQSWAENIHHRVFSNTDWAAFQNSLRALLDECVLGGQAPVSY